MNHRRRWTEEEDEQLRALSRAGMTVAQIAEHVGRTFRATAQRLERTGVKSQKQRSWSSYELRRARMLYDTGYSAQEIGVELQRTTGSVRRALDRHGGLDYARKGSGHRKSAAMVYDLKRRGLTFREIIHVLGWDNTDTRRRALSAWLRRYCARAMLKLPTGPSRRTFDPARVEAERQRLGLTAARAAG